MKSPNKISTKTSPNKNKEALKAL